MRSHRRLITVKFNHGDTLARSQVSQEKSHDVKRSKISVYAINTQYYANTLKPHCANIEPLHLQYAVSPIDIALGQMAAIQKRLTQMLRVALAQHIP